MRVVVLGCVRRPRSGPSSSMNSPCSSSSGSRQAGRQAGRQPARSQTGLHQPKTKKKGARGRGGDEHNLQWILTSRGEMGWTDSNSTNNNTSPVRCLLLYHFILVPSCPRALVPASLPAPPIQCFPPAPKTKTKTPPLGGTEGGGTRSTCPVVSTPPLRPSPHPRRPHITGNPNGSGPHPDQHCHVGGTKPKRVLGGTRQSDGYRCPPPSTPTHSTTADASCSCGRITTRHMNLTFYFTPCAISWLLLTSQPTIPPCACAKCTGSKCTQPPTPPAGRPPPYIYVYNLAVKVHDLPTTP